MLLNDDDALDSCSHWQECNPEEEYDDDFWDVPLD